jgi:UDP-N-acetylglucosamine--N-acetylmuramyl-(pentapeptide) pyrophosphoryl-undecaprenol N-acetylglucosamine transferase
MTSTWAIAGGGTGGHVTPAIALAEAVAARGDAPFLLGGEIGLEKKLVPEAGFELVTLPSGQVMGRGATAVLRAALATARGAFAAWRVLGVRRARVLISVGGYASVPGVIAAALRRIPIALVEPNAMPGRASRLAARFARAAFVQFEATVPWLRGAGAVTVVGAPMRAALVAAFRNAPARRAPGKPLRLLVFGGSQGARQINDVLIEAAPALARSGTELFHQTGEADRERVAAAYAAAGVAARVVAFERDMPARYAESDLALCRSGALTVAELAMAGLPALLVPYPHAADDHQTANARAAADAGAAIVLPARPLTADDVLRALADLAARPECLVEMAAAAARLARPDAAAQIVAVCADWQAAEGRAQRAQVSRSEPKASEDHQVGERSGGPREGGA